MEVFIIVIAVIFAVCLIATIAVSVGLSRMVAGPWIISIKDEIT